MDNQTINLAKDFIKKWEGLSLKPYICSAGVKTIGYGHVIKEVEDIQDSITHNQAESYLEQDIIIAKKILYKYCNNLDLNHNQQAALMSFIFNLGGGAFQSSTLRQKLNRNEITLAADEFLKWVHAGGRRIKGLVRRRNAERELFMSQTISESNCITNLNCSEVKNPSSIWEGTGKIKLIKFLKKILYPTQNV